MKETVPFEVRRGELVARATEILSKDSRFVAGWLEGSLADGSADSYSDIDLYLCVDDQAWDEVWANRLPVIGRFAPILVPLDIAGLFAVACLVEGPVKLDVFFERESVVGKHQRIKVKRLWGGERIFAQLRIGEDRGDSAIAAALRYNIFGFLQGATWPVRILARGQINTFLFNEILLVETAIIPLMLLEKDRRALHRNMFTRAKLISADEQALCARMVEQICAAVRADDRVAMREVHIGIFQMICKLGRAAFERYGLQFPPRVEEEMVAFYTREWPLE
ncbi:MAG: hypothetical protein WA740_17440 [Candidatus Binataceae bacterium]